MKRLMTVMMALVAALAFAEEPAAKPEDPLATFCGYKFGDVLKKSSVKKQKQDAKGNWIVEAKLNKPFRLCKNVTLLYTKTDRKLYSIAISSGEKPGLSEADARSEFEEMVKIIAEKFKVEFHTFPSELFGTAHVGNKLIKVRGSSGTVDVKRTTKAMYKPGQKQEVHYFTASVMDKAILDSDGSTIEGATPVAAGEGADVL